VVEHLFSKSKALRSNPCTVKKIEYRRSKNNNRLFLESHTQIFQNMEVNVLLQISPSKRLIELFISVKLFQVYFKFLNWCLRFTVFDES
jgi:hypothetical protein